MRSIDLTKLRTIDSVDVSGKRVLLRADLNVPMQDGRIADATRLYRFVPTVSELCDRGARVVIMSHLGRPKGQAVASLSLAPIAPALSEALGRRPVFFASDCIGSVAEHKVSELADGEVLLLENLRFYRGEEENAPGFAQRLSVLGDLYVNDAFSCAHRAHASTAAVATLLPAYGGRQLLGELKALDRALVRPERPVAALVGGAKVSTKLALLENLVHRVDSLIIGGGMANTFLYAQGRKVGRSLCERELADTARAILDLGAKSGCHIVLPSDVVVADALETGARHEFAHVDSVPEKMMVVDVGPRTVGALGRLLAACRTLLWNGPLGVFEIEPFGKGTFALAREAARLTQKGALVTVAGGGDTVAALNAAGVTDDFTYVSTAGGAFLEWLEGRDLPGIAALVQDQEMALARRG